jgi:hypothetical protein
MLFGYVGIVQKVLIFKKFARLMKYSINTHNSNGTGCSARVMPRYVSWIYIHSITLHSRFSLEHGYGANDMLGGQIRGLPGTSAHYHGRSIHWSVPVSSREPLKMVANVWSGGFLSIKTFQVGSKLLCNRHP